MYIADLHIHSRFSRATSRDLTPESLDFWAGRKGIDLVGTGDFTHPAWRQELKEKLKPEGNGLYVLDPSLRSRGGALGSRIPRFVVTGEISSIYKKNGRVRKVHSLIILPSLEDGERLVKKLETIGNIHSDGRPILGLDCRDLLEITLEICPKAIYIPAHIWTPHFSLFGAFSGFDRIEECFEDLTPHIHALETGLSSDPPMNWRLSALDPYFLVSNSDAHSPSKLGREANLLDIDLSYEGLYGALQEGKGLKGTIEFFPEEGKYHFDGHRKCHVCLSPKEAEALNNICPVCGKKLTTGVDHRAWQLSDRSQAVRPATARDFESLTPLAEVIASATGHSAAGAKVQSIYSGMTRGLGTEFAILRTLPIEEIRSFSGPMIAEGVRRLREGRVMRLPGFDGEYGIIRLFEPWEIQEMEGQMNLFSLPGFSGEERAASGAAQAAGTMEAVGAAQAAGAVEMAGTVETAGAANAAAAGQQTLAIIGGSPAAPALKTQSVPEPSATQLNPAQEQAVRTLARATAVIAGPGTGKTRTLVERILFMIRERRISPAEITAVTFTNRAAGEMRERLFRQLHKKRTLQAMKIGTFHSICYELLKKEGREFVLLREAEGLEIAAQVIEELGLNIKPARLLQEISRKKAAGAEAQGEAETEKAEASQAGPSLQDAASPYPVLSAAQNRYQEKLAALGAMDFDDLILETIKGLKEGSIEEKPFRYLLVDEFQDINPLQYELIRLMNLKGSQLFVIGDPDQSIYGFRGSDSSCFERLKEDYPELEEIRLEENYRSCGPILRAAGKLISHNPGPKRLFWTKKEEGHPLRLVSASGEMGEGIFTAKEINRMVGGIDMLDAQEGFARPEEKKTRSFGDIAVIYRTHRQGQLLERCLRQEGIPYVVAGREEFLAADSVRGSLSFFACLAGTESPMTRPLCKKLLWKKEGISEEGFEQLIAAFRPLYQKQKPGKFLESWILQMELGDDEAMEKLRSMAPFYQSMEEMCRAIESGKESDLKRCGQKTYTSDSVTLTTLHGSKGLEFPAVVLYGARKGIIPLEAKGRETQTEEERRLFFVGMTRAMEELVITSFGEPSPFLEVLPETEVIRESALRQRQREEHQISLFELDPAFGR